MAYGFIIKINTLKMLGFKIYTFLLVLSFMIIAFLFSAMVTYYFSFWTFSSPLPMTQNISRQINSKYIRNVTHFLLAHQLRCVLVCSRHPVGQWVCWNLFKTGRALINIPTKSSAKTFLVIFIRWNPSWFGSQRCL